jgi:uncharacterized FlgJ-related protein
MTELLISVEESKSKFIMKLLKEFDYVKVKKVPKRYSAEDKRILSSISAAVKELNQYKRGEIEMQDAFDMIKEIRKDLNEN